jgi:hypothetical protein
MPPKKGINMDCWKLRTVSMRFLSAAILCIPVFAMASEPPGSFSPTTITMRLTLGKTLPVCKAYLQRLNVTLFHEPPYCGRPENDHISGFSALKRIPLSPNETTALYGQLTALRAYGHTTPPIALDSMAAANAAKGGAGGAILAWRYDGGIDIDNDGKKSHIVMWIGSPVDDSNIPCGERDSRDGIAIGRGARLTQMAFVVSEDHKTVDEAMTRAVFGYPPNRMAPSIALWVGSHYFPIGDSISVFVYRGQTYFDTFLNDDLGDFQGKRRGQPSLADHMGVFTRVGNATTQVCEYSYDETRLPEFK